MSVRFSKKTINNLYGLQRKVVFLLTKNFYFNKIWSFSLLVEEPIPV